MSVLHSFETRFWDLLILASVLKSPTQSDYKGRQVHPSMKVQLSRAFAPWNKELFRLIGQTLDWADEES